MSPLTFDGEFLPKVSVCSIEIWYFILRMRLLEVVSIYQQKMEKLSKYNQKLLAIIGTTALVVFGLFILIGGGVLATELFSGFNQRQNRDNSLAVESHQDSHLYISFLQNMPYYTLYRHFLFFNVY